MGFWDTVFEVAAGALQAWAVSEMHPSLRAGVQRYSAQEFEVVAGDESSVLMRKEGILSHKDVHLVLQPDGSVYVKEDWLLGSEYMLPAVAATGSRGAGQDSREAEQVPELDAEIRFEDDQDGRLYRFELPYAVGSEQGLLVYIRKGEKVVKGQGPFMDDEGDFAAAPTQVGPSAFEQYIPFGGVRGRKRGGEHALHVLLLDASGEQARLLAQGFYELELPPRRPWLASEFLRPVVGLCMAVARADGRLDPAEIRTIRTELQKALEVPRSENEVLKAIIKQEPTAHVATLARQVAYRLPGLVPGPALDLMARVAKADGSVDALEVEIIEQTAQAFGIPEADWLELAGQLELTTIDDHYDTLGVSAAADTNPGRLR